MHQQRLTLIGRHVAQRVPRGPGRRIVSRHTADRMIAMFRDVVLEGTGTEAAIPGYTVAGKTGTANKAENGPDATAKSCIFIFLEGGPPHQDMWDPKPEAPVEIRGPFQTINTVVPGTIVTECRAEMGCQRTQAADRRSRQAGGREVRRSVDHEPAGT